MKMEQTGCSETSAYKIQMPGHYPEENTEHSFCCFAHEEMLTATAVLHHFWTQCGKNPPESWQLVRCHAQFTMTR
jgi:hypothetical protein